MTDPDTNIPDQLAMILTAVESLRTEQRAGLADVRRAVTRVAAENLAEHAATRADVARMRAELNQVIDAVAELASELHGHTHP